MEDFSLAGDEITSTFKVINDIKAKEKSMREKREKIEIVIEEKRKTSQEEQAILALKSKKLLGLQQKEQLLNINFQNDEHNNLLNITEGRVLFNEYLKYQMLLEEKTKILNNVNSDYKKNTALAKAHITKVKNVESANESSEEIEALKNEICSLLELKEKMVHKDPEVVAILTGRAQLQIDAQKMSLEVAFEEIGIGLELLTAELMQKQEEIQEEKEDKIIKEKHTRARILKMEKQIAELEETEKNLKGSADYLEKQLDHGLF